MKAKISKRSIDALPPGEWVHDTEIKGFEARCLSSGTLAYSFRYRNIKGQRRRLALGLHGNVTPDEARDGAKKAAGLVADGRDPSAEREKAKAASANTLNLVLDEFLARHVRNKERPLRSAREIERAFRKYVRGEIGDLSIYDLARRDIVRLLDTIEDRNGAVMADRVLAYLRKAFNWHATRDDSFNTPVVKGMARTRPAERARSRILDDAELRDVWRALDTLGDQAPECFPSLVRCLLLTAARRENAATMHAHEIMDDLWIIPPEKFKTKVEHVVPISAAVKTLIERRPKSGYVFSSDGGNRPFGGWSKSKRALDNEIAALRKSERRPPMQHWVLHDIRRSARSLLARAGVPDEIADRVLGHKVPGPRGTYNRHAYVNEKRDALEKLAALVERILDRSKTVVKFPRKTTARQRMT